MHPKHQGIGGVTLGIACILFTLYSARVHGEFYVALAFIGPAILPLSIGILVFPIERILKPTEHNGKLVYDSARDKFTRLGWALIGLGAVGSWLFYFSLGGASEIF